MAAPTIYRWDDTDAPIVTTDGVANNALVQAFKACLVTGYGDKSPPGAGYSLEYENTDGSAIALKSKSPDSNGFYIQIATEDAYQQTSQTYKHHNRITVCENMTDAVTRINQGLASRVFSNYSYSSNYYNDPIAWMIIADDRFFYVFTWHYYGRLTESPDIDTMQSTGNTCCGDIITPYVDPWSTVSYGYSDTNNNGSSFGQMVLMNDSMSHCRVIRAFTGEVGAKYLSVVPGGGPRSRYNNMGGCYSNNQSGYPYAPFSPDLPLFISRPLITENNTDYNGFFRGWFPGLYYPCHQSPYNNFETVVVDGKTFISVRIRVDSDDRGQVLIDLGDWWI